MNTSLGECLRGVLADDFVPRIMARRVLRLCAVLAMAATLAGCAATRLAYNQAPTLSYWWIDRHVDLNETQTGQTREDLQAFFQWHRRQELPSYASLLRQWQSMAVNEVSPAQACTQFEDIRVRLDRAAEETVEPFARLAVRLSPEQLENLRKQQAKSNEEFVKDFLSGSPEQRLRKRLDKAIERSESFYGKLDAAQRDLLRGLLQRSPFDPQRTQSERLRRQADLLQTVRDAQAEPAKAEQLVREHIARIRRSPLPGYDAYTQELVRQGCAQFATLHNSMSADQRANAVRKLKGYEDDLLVLSAQR
jgi:hypothetical protein